MSTNARADCLDDAASYWGVPPLLARAIALQGPNVRSETPSRPAPKYRPAAAASVIDQCAEGVDSQLFTSLVRQESNFNPFAIGMDGKAVLKPQPRSYEEAVRTAESLMSEGKKFSVGLGQVHISNVIHYGLTWEQAFDPCTNLRVASKILRSFHSKAVKAGYTSDGALFAALRGYNSGSVHNPVSNGYARDILSRIDSASASISEPLRQEPESASARYIGLMHINATWLPALKRYGITEADLHDACKNAYVGNWIIAQNIAQHGFNWTAVGAYASLNPQKADAYARMIFEQLARLQGG